MTPHVALRRIARLIYGEALPESSREEGSFPVIGSGGRSGLHSRFNTRGPAIVVGRKGSFGAVHWEAENCFVIDTAYSVTPLEPTTDLRWLFYAMQAVDLRGASQDVGVPGLSREAAYSVPLPDYESDEQRRIADFLDVELHRLDEVRRRRLLQVELVAEKKRRSAELLFDEQCTSRKRLKDLLRSKPRYGVLVPEFVDDGVQFVRVNDLLDLQGKIGSLRMIPDLLSRQYPTTVVAAGDVLVSVVGTLGRSVVVPPELAGANVNRALAVLRARPGNSPELLSAWLGTSMFETQAMLATASDSAQRTLGMEDLGNFVVSWPVDAKEQSRALAGLADLQAGVTDLAAVLDRQLALLAERRQALITAAVTGQIDVTTARGVTA